MNPMAGARAWALAMALKWAAPAGAGESPCQAAGLYDDWVSEPEAFPRRDQPRGLPGLHVGCVWRAADGGLVLEAHRDALRAGDPAPAAMPPGSGASWAAFRAGLQEALRIEKRTNGWGHLHLKQVFGVFAAHGERLLSVDAALGAQLIFVIVGGQWFWPPVREGFVRALPSLGMQLETLSVQPVAYRVRGFLKPQECDEIVRLGAGRMESSPVSLMDKDKGKAAKEFRTSSQARISQMESAMLWDIDTRVGNLTGLPKVHNEEIQILKYQKTQYYSSHLDNWDPSFYSDPSVIAPLDHGHFNRMITVFWYLTTVDRGGETIFPRSNGLPQPSDMWSCEHGLKVQPVKGTVIFWYSLHPNGNTDPNGLHGACPVEEGEKWAANFWVWNKPRTGSVGDSFAEALAAKAGAGGERRPVFPQSATAAPGWAPYGVVTSLVGLLVALAVFRGAPALLGGSGSKSGKAGRADRKEAKKKR